MFNIIGALKEEQQELQEQAELQQNAWQKQQVDMQLQTWKQQQAELQQHAWDQQQAGLQLQKIPKREISSLLSSLPPVKRPCRDEQELKSAGFSLSAIEEMRQTRIIDDTQKPLNQQLRHFQVLDDIGSGSAESDAENVDENPRNNGTERDDDGGDEEEDDYSDSEFDPEELENLLDENLPDDLKGPKQRKYEERFKTILDEKRHNHFEVLPEGWVQVTHNSGMPLFLHRKTRVCCASRPYFLGAGSARKHAVPVTAVPCLNYRRALDEESQMKLAAQNLEVPINGQLAITLNDENLATTEKCPFAKNVDVAVSENVNNIMLNKEILNSKSVAEGPNLQSNTTTSLAIPKSNISEINRDNAAALKKLVPAAQIVTVNENTQKESLTPNQLNNYCKNLFKFKVIRVLRFATWNERRKFTKNRKHIKNIQRPTLPDGTKLIKCPVLALGSDGNNHPRMRKEWIMNPNGKSYVCILHEYVQHALKMQPTYEFKELQNAATPYSATVSVNNLKYGTGYGTSKKQAKSEAARVTLEILIPEMRDKISGHAKDQKKHTPNANDFSVFDNLKIEDHRVAEFCNKTTEPTPHAILLTCLQRNHGLGDVQINYEINRIANKKNEFTMTVGKHTASVQCKNKREGKQLASQAILQLLHPHIKTWGSLLRLYGNNSIKTFKEKKLEEQEITVLQSKAAVNQPNYAILDKLKIEMLKLSAKHAGVHTMGTFVPPNDVDLPSTSGSNLNNVEL